MEALLVVFKLLSVKFSLNELDTCLVLQFESQDEARIAVGVGLLPIAIYLIS